MKVFLMFIVLAAGTQAFARQSSTRELWLKCNLNFCRGDPGPGGPCYAGPGGKLYAGPGGECYAGPGGRLYAGPGGELYAGPGGNCYAGPGGDLSNCPKAFPDYQ